MTTHHTPTPTAAGNAQPLICPECGEPACAAPPHDWPLSGWKPPPRTSHHDGTPLCPTIGPDGYEPAEATPVPPTQ